MPRIIDAFVFYNELELLEYRLETLDKVVDVFILVESTHTYSGKEKPLYYEENKARFLRFQEKIRHVVVRDFPFVFPNIDYEKNQQWENEKMQREAIKRGIDGLEGWEAKDTWISICDLDEIPDPKVWEQIKSRNLRLLPKKVYSLEMDFYYYDLTNYKGKWYLAKIMSLETYQYQQDWKDIRQLVVKDVVPRCGWHLSYFGTLDFISNKIQQFSHQELNRQEFIDLEKIQGRIQAHQDLFDRKEEKIIHVPLENNEHLPPNLPKPPKQTIGFFIRHFTERGTEQSVYNYAKYNEEILGNKSYIICFSSAKQKELGWSSVRISYEMFQSRFRIIELNEISEMAKVIKENQLSFFYTQTNGERDIYQFDNNEIWQNCKTIKHCVFDTRFPESDFPITISEFLNTKFQTCLPVIPYIVELPEVVGNLRKELGIPLNAIVLGRYGGMDEFNISFVKELITEYVQIEQNQQKPQIYFLFMNTSVFYQHSNILYLDGTLEKERKVKFIQTCDAMIHAREIGETFGLSVAEFSIKNKPIITWYGGDLEHIKILGNKAILYHDKEELKGILNNISTILFSSSSLQNWNAYENYTPEKIIKLFDQKIFKKERIPISNKILDSFKMKNQEYLVDNLFYENQSGNQEYRLYSYLSTFVNNAIILDIGTNTGRSAVAWSHNPNNQVISYDIFDLIVNPMHKIYTKSNIEFRVRDFLTDPSITKEWIKKVKIVMIDIDHYETIEWKMIQKLKELEFSGLILLDDITNHPDTEINQCMNRLWKKLMMEFKENACDVTKWGHWSGTGLIRMNTEINFKFT